MDKSEFITMVDESSVDEPMVDESSVDEPMVDESSVKIKLNDEEIIEFIMAEKRWTAFEKMINDKDIRFEKKVGITTWGFVEDDIYHKLFDTSVLFISILNEIDDEDIIYEWMWEFNFWPRLEEDQEKINKVRSKIVEEYSLTLDTFYTTNERLIRYIVAVVTNLLELDHITTEKIGENNFLFGHKLINND